MARTGWGSTERDGVEGFLSRLDRDRNGDINADDGWSAVGVVTANYVNNSLTMTVGDGDSVTLLNTTHLDDPI